MEQRSVTNILFKGSIYVLHYQIILLDPETDNGFPLMRTGSESVVFGERGVVVATKDSYDIEVVVCQGKDEPEHKFCVTGQIRVGDQGLVVGNIETAILEHIYWSKGRTLVTVYTNDVFLNTTKVIFFLEHLIED